MLVSRSILVRMSTEDLKATYNQIAEHWHADHAGDDWWREGTDKFISFLRSGDRVLDVGCGSGVKSRYFSEKGLQVVGVDISDKLLDIARRDAPQARFEVMDMRDVGRMNEAFDAVFAQASLLHMPKAEVPAVLHGLASVLKPEGYLYIAVKGGHPGQADEQVIEESDYGFPYKRFFSFYRMSEFEKYFADLGMKVVYKNAHMAGNTTWLQVVGRKTTES